MVRTFSRGTAPLLRAVLAAFRLRKQAQRAWRSPQSGSHCESLESRQLLSAGPSNLAASPVGTNGMNLTWQVSGNASRVTVYARASRTTTWTKLVSLRGGRQGFAATGLKSGRYYSFVVQEVANDGSTVSSNVVGISTNAVSSTPPSSGGGAGAGNGGGTTGGTITYSAPVIITHGGTYTGNWQTTSFKTPAVEIRTSEPVTILNSNLKGPGILIDSEGYNANITVRNTNGYGANPNVANARTGRFLNVRDFTNIDLEHNYLQGTAGIYLENYTGNHTAAQTIKVLYNKALDIDGRYSNGKGGYLSTGNDNDYVQFFQTNGPQNLRGAEVAWNQVTNEPGKSLIEDNINIFNTTGTADSPFLIHDNYINGAYPVSPATDREFTGGGIMVSDVGSARIQAFNNTVLNTTNYGIAISSGHDNSIYNNRVFATGVLPDGRSIPTMNVGIYIWNQNNEGTFVRNTGHDNVIGWTSHGSANDSWTPDSAGWTKNTELSNTTTNSTIQAEFNSWSQKLINNGISVGAS